MVALPGLKFASEHLTVSKVWHKGTNLFSRASCFHLSILIEAVIWMWRRQGYSSKTLEAAREREREWA